MPLQLKVVDAFSNKPLLGNPVAVVLNGSALTTDTMQAIAGWTNLSETTFVLPPTSTGCDYRLRIFTPAHELPFAGHPTLGSAHAVLEAGIASARAGCLVQECAGGHIMIDVNGLGPERQLAFTLPEARTKTLAPADVEALETALSLRVIREHTPTIVDVGPKWIVGEALSAEALLGATPDWSKAADLDRRVGATGATLYARRPDGDLEVRSFAPSIGVNEDPVCGSGNGSVGVFRRLKGLLPPEGARWVARQGRKVGRDGEVHVEVTVDGFVRVGGACVTTLEGQLNA